MKKTKCPDCGANLNTGVRNGKTYIRCSGCRKTFGEMPKPKRIQKPAESKPPEPQVEVTFPEEVQTTGIDSWEPLSGPKLPEFKLGLPAEFKDTLEE